MLLRKKKTQVNNCGPIIGLIATRNIQFSAAGSFLVPISRAILCLILTLGSICGFASCFGAQFSSLSVFIVLLICSLILAYTKNIKRNFIKELLYIVFFVVYAFFIFQYYTYVNSGYHSLVNLTYASLENYLDIPALVYYEEIIENSYTTITMFLIFWGVFELFLYHMWVTNQIRFLSIFLVSLSPLVVPFYINLRMDSIYLLCLIWGYASCIILRNSHHNVARPKKNTEFSILKKWNLLSFKHKGFAYGINGLTYFSTLIFSFVLSLIVMLLVSVVIPYPTYQRTNHDSELKKSTLDEVKYFATFGLSGYFNQYNATGGVSGGRLGGIQSVRPDYQTDLIVRMVPLNSDTIYLRGYVGVGYTNRKWLSTSELLEQKVLSKDYKSIFKESDLLTNEYSQFNDSFISPSVMKITNVDANMSYPYSTYYNDPAEIADSTFFPDGSSNFYHATRTYHYYTADYLDAIKKNSDNEVIPTAPEVLTACLQIPDTTRAEIIQFLIDHDLCTNYIVSPGTYSELSGDTLNGVISKLSDCMTNDFVYSLNPGLTPRNADYVGYFLNNSQKGFCAHFATSAALILRTLGIPTRYVEGYVVSYDDLIEATLVPNENVSDYISLPVSNNRLNVLDIEIGDDKAHAWLEYYDPDFGWRVFEATTAASEQYGSPDFWNSLYGFLNQTAQQDTNLAISDNYSGASILQITIRIGIGLIILLFLIIIGYYSYRYTRQYRSYHRNRDNINVRNLYKIIAGRVSRRYPSFAYLVTFTEQLDFIMAHYKLSKVFTPNVVRKLIGILEQAAFARESITATEAAFALKLLHLMRRNIILNIKKRPE